MQGNNTEYAYTRYEYPQNAIQSQVWSTVNDVDGDGNISEDEVYAESWADGAGRVRRARTEHPGSAGGWTGTITEYDILGRVKRSTIPTEISVPTETNPDSWQAAGDDSVRGFLWKYQKYDWMGRVTRVINTDGVDLPALNDSDQLISYDGCGCAGGQVTTIQGELVPRDDNPNLSARRTQKVYADILGRTKKTEIMNWDAATVYTTTTQIFNGRDQVLQTVQYAGAESQSNTHQTVSMTYDGHGRMKTRHYPIEDAQTETTWIYNNDDSIQQVIDPRNAITTFSYNSRGLVSNIGYAVPSPNPLNIPVTPNVSFSYDALGNRTQMTDGLGTQTYEYNQLSQLLSETRNFNETVADAPAPNNGFKIEYGYNLSGGLKFYKNPYGHQIDYTNDKTGRLTQVTGSSYGTGAEATTLYADTITYRAWGAVKSLFYRTNDNPHVRMYYDNRLRVASHEVESYQREGGFVKKATFSYLADSRPAAMDNVVNPEFDRTYKYDHVGRLKENRFGDVLYNPSFAGTPYQQTITYDAFSQMTNRNTDYWGENTEFTSTFTNGREQTNGITGTQYDAAGNMTNTGSRTSQSGVYQASIFDVASRRTLFTSRTRQRSGRYSYIYTERAVQQSYDGDGHALKQQEVINNTPMAGSEKYQIWSSVLQSFLTETAFWGRTSKVFAGGAVIAEQIRRWGENNTHTEEVGWIHADPVSGSSERVLKSGAQYYRTEYEPLGNQEVSVFGLEEEFPEPQNYQGEVEPKAEEPQWQCQVASAIGTSFFGMPTHCQRAIMQSNDFGPDVWGGENNPSNIGDPPGPKHDDGQTGKDGMPVDPNPTDKPQGGESGEEGAVSNSSVGSMGNDAGNCEYDAEGKPTCSVQVMSNSVPGHVDASQDYEGTYRRGKKGLTDFYYDLQTFLREKSNCLESLKKLGFDMDKFQSALDRATSGAKTTTGSDLLNKTFAELGFTNSSEFNFDLEMKLGEASFVAATNVDTGDVYYSDKYFNQTKLERGLTVFHEALHIYLKRNHANILRQLNLPVPKGYTIPATEPRILYDVTGKVIGKTDGIPAIEIGEDYASFEDLDKWLRGNCPAE